MVCSGRTATGGGVQKVVGCAPHVCCTAKQSFMHVDGVGDERQFE